MYMYIVIDIVLLMLMVYLLLWRCVFSRSACSIFEMLPFGPLQSSSTPSPIPPTKSFDFGGFDSSKLLILRGGNYHIHIISNRKISNRKISN